MKPVDFRALLSKYRGAIMGIAAVLVICYHTPWNSPLPLYNHLIGMNGNVSVDIFLFLSGFGLAHSLRRGGSFSRYYARRLSRVLPAYYGHILVMFLLTALTGLLLGKRVNLGEFLLQWVVPIGVWINRKAPKWYVSAVLGYYVVAALAYQVLHRSRRLYPAVAALLLVTAVYVPVMSRMDKAILAFTRMPALVLGLAVGEASQSEDPRYRRTWPALAWFAALFLAGLALLMLRFRIPGLNGQDREKLWRVGLNLCAPLLAILMALILALLDRARLGAVVRIFSRLGALSLEVYLAHTTVTTLLEPLRLPELPVLLLTIVGSYPAALALRWLADRLLAGWRALLPRLVKDPAPAFETSSKD